MGQVVRFIVYGSAILVLVSATILNRYDRGPLYLPPSERGAINQPGWGGGANL